MHRRLLTTVLALTACKATKDAPDADFAAMQERGRMVMGVDQYTYAHVFEDLPDGGRVVLDRDSTGDTSGGEVRIRSTDPVAVAAIHEFLAFQRGGHHAAGHEPPKRSR